MRLVTVSTVVLPTPVLDENGKQVRFTGEYKGRQMEIDAYDHDHVKPGTTIDVPDDVAEELIAKKAARKPVAGLDTDFDTDVEDEV